MLTIAYALLAATLALQSTTTALGRWFVVIKAPQASVLSFDALYWLCKIHINF